jgi:hypothetical protein
MHFVRFSVGGFFAPFGNIVRASAQRNPKSIPQLHWTLPVLRKSCFVAVNKMVMPCAFGTQAG